MKKKHERWLVAWIALAGCASPVPRHGPPPPDGGGDARSEDVAKASDGMVDAGNDDRASVDVASDDGMSTVDAGIVDADAEITDVTVVDAGLADTGVTDAGPPDAGPLTMRFTFVSGALHGSSASGSVQMRAAIAEQRQHRPRRRRDRFDELRQPLRMCAIQLPENAFGNGTNIVR